MNREVQRILKRVAGLDVGKVFKTRLGKISNPSYKLVTGEELEEVSCDRNIHFNKKHN